MDDNQFTPIFRVWDGKRMWDPPLKNGGVWLIDRTGMLWKTTQFADQTTSERRPDCTPLFDTGHNSMLGIRIFDKDLVMWGAWDGDMHHENLWLVGWNHDRSAWCLFKHGRQDAPPITLGDALQENQDLRVVGNIYHPPWKQEDQAKQLELSGAEGGVSQ